MSKTTFIVRSDIGFLISVNAVGQARWSEEYPDAMKFRTKAAAYTAIKTIPISARLAGAEIIGNYGEENQFSIPASA